MIRTLVFAAKSILSPQGRVFYLPMANPRGSPPHITCVRLNLPGDSIHIGSAGFGDSFGLVRRPGCGELDAWQLSINKAVLAQVNLNPVPWTRSTPTLSPAFRYDNGTVSDQRGCASSPSPPTGGKSSYSSRGNRR